MVSTARDTHGRRTVVELVPSRRRLYPVGRLDADTSGLILLTNDGELANQLTHPRYEVDKTYRARVEPAPVAEAALRQLREGVELEDGRTSPAKVRQVEPGLLEIVLREGRKRQVRRMCEAVGHRVMELERTAFGPLGLEKLPEGEFRPLSPAEVERLRKAARLAQAAVRGLADAAAKVGDLLVAQRRSRRSPRPRARRARWPRPPCDRARCRASSARRPQERRRARWCRRPPA